MTNWRRTKGLPMGRMKKIAIIAGAILIVLAGAVVVIPMLIPSDVYRQTIEAALAERGANI